MKKNKKYCIKTKEDITYRIRTKRKKDDKWILRCGCCLEKVKVFVFGSKDTDGTLIEINGVLTTYGEWKRVLKYIVSQADTDE